MSFHVFIYLFICLSAFFISKYWDGKKMEQRPRPPRDFFGVPDKSLLSYPQLGLIRQMICVMECLNTLLRLCAPKWFPFVKMKSKSLLSEVLPLPLLCTLCMKVNCWIGQTAKSLSEGCWKFSAFHLRGGKKQKQKTTDFNTILHLAAFQALLHIILLLMTKYNFFSVFFLSCSPKERKVSAFPT